MKGVLGKLAEWCFSKKFEIKITGWDIEVQSFACRLRRFYGDLGEVCENIEDFFVGLIAKLNWVWLRLRPFPKDEFDISTSMDLEIVQNLSPWWRERYHNNLARRRQRLHKAELEKRDRENLKVKPDGGGSEVAFKLTGKTSDETLEEDFSSIHSSDQINFEGPPSSDMRINAGLVVSSDDLEKERAALNENPKVFFREKRRSGLTKLKDLLLRRRKDA